MKSFNESQFAYCPLEWMCYDKKSDTRKTTYNALRKVSSDNVSTFEKRLIKGNSVTIHVRNLRILAAELYKIKKNLAASIMHKVFEKKNIKHYPCSQADFQLRSVKTVNCGLRALRYLGPKI